MDTVHQSPPVLTPEAPKDTSLYTLLLSTRKESETSCMASHYTGDMLLKQQLLLPFLQQPHQMRFTFLHGGLHRAVKECWASERSQTTAESLENQTLYAMAEHFDNPYNNISSV
ncbi:unnamed protein product [Tetraodon nigroviridis]|uniref:(spotted green pufferfish) hypothetical protein n=1 Tax=Tetraodon nigroviridis TaxID=99883 RepID=Q4RKU8_TETNG|nr:unnamed protein product [Tetraodon nigroviridis]